MSYNASKKCEPNKWSLKWHKVNCRELGEHTIFAEIVSGPHKGKKVFIPRIPLQTSDSEKNGILFMWTQFPVHLCFAMTINKSQGQTLDYVWIYLYKPAFSHGQLYVALSRVRSSCAVKVLIISGTFDDLKVDGKTRNVVFCDIFRLTKIWYIRYNYAYHWIVIALWYEQWNVVYQFAIVLLLLLKFTEWNMLSE